MKTHAFAALLLIQLLACGDDSAPTDTGIDVIAPSDAGADGASDATTDSALPDRGSPDAPVACGDGVLSGDEDCDDGNTAAGDGCSDACETESNFVCVVAGEPCVRVVTCGNARLEGDETCDDRNDVAGDGCSDSCLIEDGWVCPAAGRACSAAACGDGIVAGFERCDDGNEVSGDGCSDSCVLEDGFMCATAGMPCTTTTCGDGVPEGTEACDDGNLDVGDGCSPFCEREPDCTDGTCVAFCGDGVVFAPETCDDGNAISGDGCSATCQEEDGFTCTETLPEPPDSVVLPIILRDFIGECAAGARLPDDAPGATPPFSHPDFQCFSGAEDGIVMDMLDGEGRPVYAGAAQVEDAESFARWYRSQPDYNRTVAQALTLNAIGGGAYRFDSSSFFPLTNPVDGSAPQGFVVEGLEDTFNEGDTMDQRNFYFTSEVRYWFEYAGTEELAFSGDDDVWVFINGRLAVDIGGVHGRLDDSVTLADCANADPAMNDASCLNPLDLRVGGIYEAVVFQAERRQTRSQYRLTLTNFNAAPSVCEFECGDGIVTPFEGCDEGEDNGAEYNGCSDTCELTPFCGDGIVQEAFGEVCDDGLNLGGGPSACAPGCMDVGARCGDGVVQTETGEQCDDGNNESMDGCSADCRVELL